MYIAFLDEFGHVGPFVSRSHKKHNSSPVFGLAGMILPQENIRYFSRWFFQRKAKLFPVDLAATTKHPAIWEKKGSAFFTPNKMAVPRNREVGFRLINKITKLDGFVFFHGREKYKSPEDSSPTGLYSTVLAESMRRIDSVTYKNNKNYLMILDEHSGRADLIRTSMKTMHGSKMPVRHILEPPFQAESNMYNTLQAADWIATIVGRLWAYRVRPTEYPTSAWAEKYFGSRIESSATHSSFYRHRPPRPKKAPPATPV